MKLPISSFKAMNPEDDDNDRWEEDTTDTEIMKNINSLLDSDLYDSAVQTNNQINIKY